MNMPLDTTNLQQFLCEKLCSEVRVIRRPDGKLMLHTGFTFPDGDRFPIHVLETPTNRVRLSDLGHTLMHISYDHDIDLFLLGTRRQLFDTIVNESGISLDDGIFYSESPFETVSDTIFRFGQALTRVYDLTFLSQSRVKSIFHEDLTRLR